MQWYHLPRYLLAVSVFYPIRYLTQILDLMCKIVSVAAPTFVNLLRALGVLCKRKWIWHMERCGI